MPGTPSPFDLGGRVAVVTGGNGGIGRSIALGLARAGAAVAVLARNDEKNRRVLAELKSLGVPAMALRTDVTQRETLGPAIADVERELGGVDILVNNAGIATRSGGVLHETEATWDATIETHLNACFPLSQYMTAAIRENPGYAKFNALILARTPANRWGQADELAGAAVFLASHAADFVTGVTLAVDGGYSIA